MQCYKKFKSQIFHNLYNQLCGHAQDFNLILKKNVNKIILYPTIYSGSKINHKYHFLIQSYKCCETFTHTSHKFSFTDI